MILHIITDLDNGGAEAVLYRLCTFDNNESHHVVSLTDEGKYGCLLSQKGIPVTCLHMPKGRIRWSALSELWQLIRRLRPDVIQTWMYHADLIGGIVAFLAGHRNISWGIHHSDLTTSGTSRNTIRVAKLCALLSYVVPKTIICCAQNSKDSHRNFGYSGKRLRVISNGYDLLEFQPDYALRSKLRAELKLDAAQPVIGFVARYNPLKDHYNLLQSLKILKLRGKTITCLLVGDGMTPENEVLMKNIDALKLTEQVHLLGARNDVPAIMNALDLHVLSSSSEAFPNVLAEAMSCGTPCVTTNVGDAARIVGKTGKVVPTGDSEALAEAIETLIMNYSSPDWQRICADSRRHIVDSFSLERMVINYRKSWHETENQ